MLTVLTILVLTLAELLKVRERDVAIWYKSAEFSLIVVRRAHPAACTA
jgi:hypothetical protein